MTLQELYQNIDGDYDQAIRVLRIEKLMDKHIRKFNQNGVVKEVLAAAGLARFESKTARFARQSASQDPEQTLYESVFECLA